MMPVISNCFAPVTLIFVLTSIWSATVAASPRGICGAYRATEKAVILEVSTGCVSSSSRYKSQSIEAEIDETTATIRIFGKFSYAKPKGRIVKMDCMGHRSLKLKLKGVQARRYSVVTDKGFAGILDFAADHNRRCLKRQRGVGIAHASFARNLVTKLLPVSDGQTIQEIIAPLLRKVAVAHEGLGSLSLNIYKPGNRGTTNRAVAEIKALDLADDSVAGLHFTVILRSTGQSWKAVMLSRRSLCARGRQAGQWTDGQCS